LLTNLFRMRFQFSIIIIVLMLCFITTKSASKYEGVYWNKKRNLLQAEFYVNGEKQTSFFKNESDAAKKLDNLCDKMENFPQNQEICEILNQQKHEKTSQHKGVFWHKQLGKWYALIYPKGQKRKYGGTFSNELNAAKKVNELCEELGIPLRNLIVSEITNQQYQAKGKTSQYKGVFYHKQSRKWQVLVTRKGHKQIYGGRFNDELDAAKKANEILKDGFFFNKGKMSHYRGVYRHKQREKWYVLINLQGQKKKYGGIFKDELDAAKRVNQLCEELGIPSQNPQVSAIPNQK